MLHIIKLAVGVRDPAHLREIQAHRLSYDPPLRHLTRHMPRRGPEITQGGSLFWVIAGTLLMRQAVTDIIPAEREDGSACAALLLHPELVPVVGRPVKAFQGWRYLQAEDAPPDLAAGSIEAQMPHEMAQQLRELCLL